MSTSLPDSPTDIRAAIEAQNARICAWYAAGDVESLVSAFAEDAWQMPPNQPPLVGRPAIRAFWSQLFAAGRVTFELTVENVASHGPLAVERGRYRLAFVAGVGAPPQLASFEDRGHYLAHWQKEADGQWRIVADAPVSDQPAPPRP